MKKIKQEIEQEEKEKCTFKPEITKYKPTESQFDSFNMSKTKKDKHAGCNIAQGGNRCQELYELSKKNQKKDDKATDDYIYEKEKSAYTFAPDLTKEQVRMNQAVNAGLVTETIERLKRGREEREKLKKALERGTEDLGMRFDMESNKFKKGSYSQISSLSKHLSSTQNKNNSEKNPSEEKEKDELLYIDVNLGDLIERIVVHEGDSAFNLADAFTNKHSKKSFI